MTVLIGANGESSCPLDVRLTGLNAVVRHRISVPPISRLACFAVCPFLNHLAYDTHRAISLIVGLFPYISSPTR